MRALTTLLAISLSVTSVPSLVSAKAGFLPGAAQAEARASSKSRTERQADRQKRIEQLETKRKAQELKRLKQVQGVTQ